MTDGALPLDLGGGLVLRSATPDDAEKLATFNAAVHADAPGERDEGIAVWTRDLLRRPHPTFRPELFTLVEEAATGRIASSLNLIPQTWAYDGVAFGVGRIELVGTDPDFRRRGLVRRQMEVAHRWSAERGDLLQGITGIPWYYRQFGYEMGLELDGHRRVAAVDVPDLAAGRDEPYGLRPATAEDVPFMAAADAHGRARSLVSCVRDGPLWRYELDGRSNGNAVRRALAVIEGSAGGDGPARPVAFVAHAPALYRGALLVSACEAVPGASWLAIAPGLLRALRGLGEGYAAAGGGGAGAGPVRGGGGGRWGRGGGRGRGARPGSSGSCSTSEATTRSTAPCPIGRARGARPTPGTSGCRTCRRFSAASRRPWRRAWRPPRRRGTPAS